MELEASNSRTLEETPRRSKASPAQLNYLADHMKNHPIMASGVGQSLQGRASLEVMWAKLTEELNALGGPIKNTDKWKQAWRDMKANVKRKASLNKREFRGYGAGSTGNGPPIYQELTQVEDKVLEVMGPVAVFGMEEIVSTEPIPRASTSNPQPVEPQSPTLLLDRHSRNIPGPSNSRPQKRKLRREPKHENFDTKLLKIEEEKLIIKRERNKIEQERNVALNRLTDVLQELSNKLFFDD